MLLCRGVNLSGFHPGAYPCVWSLLCPFEAVTDAHQHRLPQRKDLQSSIGKHEVPPFRVVDLTMHIGILDVDGLHGVVQGEQCGWWKGAATPPESPC